MEDDTEVECAILTVFPVDAKEYIALLPLDENGQNESGKRYRHGICGTDFFQMGSGIDGYPG